MANQICAGLNSEQKKAVTHQSGPLLIIAGAGTGKTTVITHRIAHLIVERKVRPEEILALTFTDKASFQMQEKVDILVPYGFTDTWIDTFHAFGDRVLRDNALELGLDSSFRVLTRPEAAVFFQENLFRFPLKFYRPLGTPTKFIDALLALFSRARDEDVSVKEYFEYAQNLLKRSHENPADEALKEEAERQLEIAKCYETYQSLLLKNGKMDFANQFHLTLELFRKHPSTLKRYQDQFKHILIDEFQDTNYAQFELVKHLAQKAETLTVVADDDQSIYKWRGAAVSNIIHFMKIYPDSEKIALTKNYRSTQPILDGAYRLIQQNNPDRFEVQAKINKRLIGRTKKGKKIEHKHFETLSFEADWVAGHIAQQVKAKKYLYNDFAILVRSNADADPFLRALNMRGIPWQFSGSQGLYSREEIKLCISFLRIIADPTDSLSLYFLASSPLYHCPSMELAQVMHYTNRKRWHLFDTLKNLETLNDAGAFSSDFIDAKNKIIKNIQDFVDLSRAQSTGRLLYLFLIQTGYLKSLVEDNSLENESKIKNIAKFFDAVRNFEYITQEDRVWLFVNYLDMLIQAGDDPSTAEPEKDVLAVNVLTIHKAKGLEFPVVFLVSVVEGKFPCTSRKDPLELPDELIKDILPLGDFHMQEERRLFYVGMTRAAQELYITSAVDYGQKRPRQTSRFIIEALSKNAQAKVLKTSVLEAIERNAPQAQIPLLKDRVMKENDVLTLSYFQIDDYLTCPLKYKYVHMLRIPIMEHHTVLYGKALHDTIQHYYQNRIQGVFVSQDELLKFFNDSFRKEGFLSREHIELRLKAGEEALARFYQREKDSKVLPTYIEKDFSFHYQNNRIIGRWDRIDVVGDLVKIIDFKSSLVDKQDQADKKAKDSLQLSLYGLAYLEVFARLPDYLELHFLESGLIGQTKVAEKNIQKVHKAVEEASSGIRSFSFEAKPTPVVCRYCAYNQICPSAKIV